MRKHYNGNSYYLIPFAIIKLMPVLLIAWFLLTIEVSNQVIIIGVSIIILILLAVLFGLRKLVYVDFREEHFVIRNFITGTKEHVLYHNLKGLTVIDGRHGKHNYDVISYKVRSRTKNVQVDRIVNFEEYIDFFTWLKTKNEKIKIEITPTDSKLIKDYKKAFSN